MQEMQDLEDWNKKPDNSSPFSSHHPKQEIKQETSYDKYKCMYFRTDQATQF